jgi:ABC-type Fe3+/spermidine/putrescine transport system ATPase subunit
MVMNTGVIEQIGKPHDIYVRPQTVFAARFVGDINLLSGEVSGKQGDLYVVKTGLGELRVASDKDYSGHKLAYGIRPEAIVVGDEALKCENHFQAKGLNSYYFGNSVECVFEMQDGVTLKASVAPEVAPSVMRDGAVLGWRARDSMLIEKPSVIEGLNVEEVIYGK